MPSFFSFLARISLQVVVAIIARQDVVTRSTIKRIIAVAPAQNVVAVTAPEDIIAATAQQYIIPFPADDRDTPLRPRRIQDVVSGPTVDDDRQLDMVGDANVIVAATSVDLDPLYIECFEGPDVTAIGQESAYLRLLRDMDSGPKPCL